MWEVQRPEFSKVAELGRRLASKLGIGAESQMRQLREVSQTWRYAPCQPVLCEAQLLQARKVA